MKKTTKLFCMMEHDEILKEIDAILNQLIQNAQKLREVSRQVLAEEELGPLQSKQEELLTKLCEADSKYKKAVKGKIDDQETPLRKKISEKLSLFEKLNANFIENLSSSHGLIQFELNKRNKKNSDS